MPRSSNRSRKPFQILKPTGALTSRVQLVGPQHFGILVVDPAKDRSKFAFSNFYGEVLIEPFWVAHTKPMIQEAIVTIQQTIEADRKRPLIADSPHPASPSPTQPASSTPQLTETIRVAQPGEAQNPPARPLEPVVSLNGLTSLGAPIETRGGQPDLNAPEAPSIPTSLPATLPATTVVEATVAPAMPPVVETPAQTPPTTAEPTIAATPTSPEQAATAPMSQPPTQPAAPDPTAAVEQQARQEAEALAMQQ